MRIHSEVKITGALESDMNTIRSFIEEFRLDDSSMEVEQFLVAKIREKAIGFGRIREHSDCSELCSLGVIEPERNKGMGTKLTSALIKKAKQKLFLVCVIPDFFEPHGFRIAERYPEALVEKLHRCERDLYVPEKYVVMKKISD